MMIMQRSGLHRLRESARPANPAVYNKSVSVRQRSSASLQVVCSSNAKFFVGGNWKANGSVASVKKLVEDLNAGTVSKDAEVVCAPPFIYLDYVMQHLDSTKYKVSAQNCWLTGNGAYTGEVTAEMLKDFGVPWVILGHSERRSLFGESNEVVAKKSSHALGLGVGVIACVGETLDQRNSGSMYQVLDFQLQALVDEIKDWSQVVLAYEPVWAIGTGVVATPEQAQEVHAYLRNFVVSKLGAATASKLRIIYGGSVSDSNCLDLAKKEDIDGFLVGGASLKGASFVTICNAVSAKSPVKNWRG